MKLSLLILTLLITSSINAQKIEKPPKIIDSDFTSMTNEIEVDFYRCNINFLFDSRGYYAGAYDSLFMIQYNQLFRIKLGNSHSNKMIQINKENDEKKYFFKGFDSYFYEKGKVIKKKIKKPEEYIVRSDSGTYLNLNKLPFNSNCIIDVHLYYTTDNKTNLYIPIQNEFYYHDVSFSVEIPEIYDYLVNYQNCEYKTEHKTFLRAIVVGYEQSSGPKRLVSKNLADAMKRSFPSAKYDEVYCAVDRYKYTLVNSSNNLKSGLVLSLNKISIPKY